MRTAARDNEAVSTNEAWYETADKDGMTLDELAAWFQNAAEFGVPGDARPTVIVTGSGHIKKIEAAG
jgi:hypothetical protein